MIPAAEQRIISVATVENPIMISCWINSIRVHIEHIFTYFSITECLWHFLCFKSSFYDIKTYDSMSRVNARLLHSLTAESESCHGANILSIENEVFLIHDFVLLCITFDFPMRHIIHAHFKCSTFAQLAHLAARQESTYKTSNIIVKNLEIVECIKKTTF